MSADIPLPHEVNPEDLAELDLAVRWNRGQQEQCEARRSKAKDLGLARELARKAEDHARSKIRALLTLNDLFRWMGHLDGHLVRAGNGQYRVAMWGKPATYVQPLLPDDDGLDGDERMLAYGEMTGATRG